MHPDQLLTTLYLQSTTTILRALWTPFGGVTSLSPVGILLPTAFAKYPLIYSYDGAIPSNTFRYAFNGQSILRLLTISATDYAFLVTSNAA